MRAVLLEKFGGADGLVDGTLPMPEFERRLDGDELDVVGLAHDVFGRQLASTPADQPPARWSSRT